MISNTELRKKLNKEVLNLDESQLNSIRTFLVQMATIEYNQYRENKRRVRNYKSNRIIQLSQYANKIYLKIA